MRPLPSVLLFAGLVLLAAPAALAHPHPDDAVPRYHIILWPNEARLVYGTYELSNGDVLKVSRSGRHFWAEMGYTGRIEIVPVDWYVFVEKGGNLRFTFIPYGFPDEVKISGLAERGVPVAGTRQEVDSVLVVK
jgi:hypothetical protein